MNSVQMVAVCSAAFVTLGGAMAQTSLGAVSAESAVKWSDISSAVSPQLDAGLLASIQNGTLEIRQKDIYDPASSTLEWSAFLVQPGSPLPTPDGAAGLTTLWWYTVSVDKAQAISKPRPSIAFFGSIQTVRAAGPFGDITGVPIVISATYTSAADGTASFGVITADLVGTATLVSQAGKGMLKMAVPQGPPTAWAGPKGIEVTTPAFQLDGRQSSDPSGGSLTYSWVFLPVSGQTVNLTGANTATPSVTLPDGAQYGDYRFQLTVTSAAGQTAADQVVITYIAPEPAPSSGQ